MPRSPEPARRRILDAALALFAERGISGVSLREVRIAARQRNAGALHYHFGSKDGLLKALLQRELPPLIDRRRKLIAKAKKAGGRDPRPVAQIFVLPFAELACGEQAERALVLLLAQLHDDVSLSLGRIMELVGDTAIGEATKMLRARLKGVPAAVLTERLVLANSMFLHAAATRARGGKRERRLDDDAFSRNLVDMFLGCVAAPAAKAPARKARAKAKRGSRG